MNLFMFNFNLLLTACVLYSVLLYILDKFNSMHVHMHTPA